MKKVFTYMLIKKKSAGFLRRFGGICLFLFANFLVHAKEATSTVKDESSQPLPQAGAWIQSTRTGVTTADGNILLVFYIK